VRPPPRRGGGGDPVGAETYHIQFAYRSNR
jgi:hypothetical protein